MRFASRLLALSLIAAVPAFAQAPVAPTAPAPPPAESAPAVAAAAEEPSVEEHRIVAFAASGVSLAALISGVAFGVSAQLEFNCAKDILACNQTLQNKVVGEELFDTRAEIEHKALVADMSYLLAGAAAVVATVGFLQGFVFAEEPPAPAPVASLPPSVVVATAAR